LRRYLKVRRFFQINTIVKIKIVDILLGSIYPFGHTNHVLQGGMIMKTLTKEELKKMKDRREDFELINVLGKEVFEKEHIPGSANIPITEEFGNKIKEKYPDKDRKIVVYCASFECHSSPAAAKRLEQMGYTNVYDYEGGMKDWKDGGYPVEGKEN
jgi:rhodanese-related sulfurtransferase